MKEKSALENLAHTLSKLPGIGLKSATRIAYSLIRTPNEFNKILGESISTIQDKVKPCSVCGAFTETDPCPICTDSTRDQSLLCIVEQPQDVLTIQSSNAYSGLFHVLGGAINPINGVGPEDLSFNKLKERIAQGSFKEVIIATNPTEEGDITAIFIRQILSSYPDIKLTRLASGLPVGGDLEYADMTTLKRSFGARFNF
ncbi:MAG: recombination protein RecR [Sphaerochaetaceae bacterium]|nr:recombination protein RecR [Sphaerochaetaceae bacterium]